MTNNYTAWALRYVPNAARGEFINFGILCGRDGGDWALRHVADLSRANCITPVQPRPGDLLGRFASAVDMLNGESTAVGGQPAADQLWGAREAPLRTAGVQRIADLSRNALQFSAAMPSVGASADDVAERLYALLVVDPVHVRRPQPRTVLRNRVRELIDQLEIPESQALPQLQLRSNRATARVDYLFGPEGPVKLTHCLTFARQDADVSRKEADFWSFFVDGIRERGANSRIGTGSRERTVTVPKDIDVSVIYDPPISSAQQDALAAAMDGWNRVGITPVPVSGAVAEVASTAELLPA